MPQLPYSHNRVVDVIIAAMRASNLLNTDAGAELIRLTPENLSAADVAQRGADAGPFGPIASGGTPSNILSSSEDINIFTDDDNTDTSPTYRNVLRVWTGTMVPTTDPLNDVFSVGPFVNSGNDVFAQFGPSLEKLSSGDDFPAIVNVGSGFPISGAASPYLTISGAQAASTLLTLGNFNILSGGDRINFSGFSSGTNDLSFIQVQKNGDWYIEPQEEHPSPLLAAQSSVYLRGKEGDPNDSNVHPVKFCVGGTSGPEGYDPDLIYFTQEAADATPTECEATCLIISPVDNQQHFVLRTVHSGDSAINSSHLVNFHSEMELLAPFTPDVRLLSCSGNATPNGANMTTTKFSVRADGRVTAKGPYLVQDADVAEYFHVEDPESFEPGTVVVLNAAGAIEPSASYAAKNVLGVVSTAPGVGLACIETSDEVRTDAVPIAMTGTVPVRVLGAVRIETMDLLVSASGGFAEKAPRNPEPGTVIGKALEPFDGDEGVIKMLVIHR